MDTKIIMPLNAIASDLRRHQVPLPLIFGLMCKLKGFSVNEFAEFCGYTRNYVYKCLAGEANPSPILIQKTSEFLGFNLWDIGMNQDKK